MTIRATTSTMSSFATTPSRALLTAIAVAAVVAGCTTTTTQSFRVVRNSAVESAQVSTTADFGKYRRLLAEDMGVFFPSESPSSNEDIQRIRDIFRRAFLEELADYDIVRRPGPATMAVKASLIDLRRSGGEPPGGLRSSIRELAVPGSFVFLMELKDSQTGEILARAADSAPAPTFAVGSDIETDWETVETSARNWAALFRGFLDANLDR